MKTMSRIKYFFLKSGGVLIFIGIFLGMVENAHAQRDSRPPRLRLGVRGGFNVNNITTDLADQQRSRIGFNAGVAARYRWIGFVQLQSELVYIVKGGNLSYAATNNGFGGNIVLGLRYFEVPSSVVFNFFEIFHAYAGVYGSYLAGANILASTVPQPVDLGRDDISTFDLGYHIGASVRVRPFNIGARYSRGVINLTGSRQSRDFLQGARHSVLQIYLLFWLDRLF
jgi:hypothetical protein